MFYRGGVSSSTSSWTNGGSEEDAELAVGPIQGWSWCFYECLVWNPHSHGPTDKRWIIRLKGFDANSMIIGQTHLPEFQQRLEPRWNDEGTESPDRNEKENRTRHQKQVCLYICIMTLFQLTEPFASQSLLSFEAKTPSIIGSTL